MSAPFTTRPTRAWRRCCAMTARSFPKLAEATLAGPALRGNRLSLKAGGPELLCLLVHGEKADTLARRGFQQRQTGGGRHRGGPARRLGLRRRAISAGSPLREFLFYKPGEKTLTVRPVEEPAPGQVSVWRRPELRPGPAGAARHYARRRRRGAALRHIRRGGEGRRVRLRRNESRPRWSRA